MLVIYICVAGTKLSINCNFSANHLFRLELFLEKMNSDETDEDQITFWILWFE